MDFFFFPCSFSGSQTIWCSSVDSFFFPYSLSGSQTIRCSSVLLLMFFGRSQTRFFLCFQILASDVLPDYSLSTSINQVFKTRVLYGTRIYKTQDASLQNHFKRLWTNYIVSPYYARLQISSHPSCLQNFKKIKNQLLCHQINVKISNFCNLKLSIKK